MDHFQMVVSVSSGSISFQVNMDYKPKDSKEDI